VKRIPTLLSLIVFPIVVGFFVLATAQVRFDATLEKDLHAKRVKVGDTFTARIKSEVVLQDGTRVPKNSKLQGHVTEVKKAEGKEPSMLGLLFDRLILDKKEEKPIAVTLISVAPPAAQKGVDNLSAQSGMTGVGRISAMAAETGRADNQESAANVMKNGVGTNLGSGSDPALSPGISSIEGVTLSYKASGPDTILENRKDDVFVQRWTKMLFQVN
jgi:hypothetical protein